MNLWSALGEIFTKFENNACKILNACYTMKKGANGSTVNLKTKEFIKLCFVLVLPRRPNTQGYVYLMLNERFTSIFLKFFSFSLAIGIAWKKKLSQQWIHLFIEKLMVQILSR